MSQHFEHHADMFPVDSGDFKIVQELDTTLTEWVCLVALTDLQVQSDFFSQP